MKKILSLILLNFMFFGLDAKCLNFENLIQTNLIEINETVTDIYPAVAKTEKGYGQEYSIGIEIHGTKTSYSSSITKVVCGGYSVSYSVDYTGTNKYYFSKGGETYYFYF